MSLITGCTAPNQTTTFLPPTKPQRQAFRESLGFAQFASVSSNVEFPVAQNTQGTQTNEAYLLNVPSPVDSKKEKYYFLDQDPTKRGKEKPTFFDTYDVQNEVKFMRKIQHLPQAHRDYYLEENIKSFVLEHAAKGRYKALPGILTVDGRLDILGFDMAKMIDETAILAQEQSGKKTHEASVSKGMKNVINLLQEQVKKNISDPTKVRVGWLSPSIVSDYGFQYIFEVVGDYDPKIQGYPLREKVLRYDEEFLTTDRSKEIYGILQEITGQNRQTSHLEDLDDIVTSPIPYTANKNTDTRILSDIFDIHQDDIDFSEAYEKEIQTYLHDSMGGYIGLINKLVNCEHESEEDVRAAEDAIGRIYYWSQVINKEMRQKKDYSNSLNSRNRPANDDVQLGNVTRFDMYSAYGNAAYQQFKHDGGFEIQGGVHCPIVKKKKGDDIGMSNSQIGLSLFGGFSMDDAAHLMTATEAQRDVKLCRCHKASGPHWHCDGNKQEKDKFGNDVIKSCNHAIVVGKNVTKCPGCGKGKVC